MHLFLVKVSDDREERRAWREQIMMIRGRAIRGERCECERWGRERREKREIRG